MCSSQFSGRDPDVFLLLLTLSCPHSLCSILKRSQVDTSQNIRLRTRTQTTDIEGKIKLFLVS